MARLHSFYISNAQQELNYAGKDLSDDAFNQVMQSCVSFISDSDMFDDEIEDDDDNDPFENLVPDDIEIKDNSCSFFFVLQGYCIRLMTDYNKFQMIINCK